MISAFGVDHGLSKSQLPGIEGYKPVTQLTETDKHNIRHTIGYDDRNRFGRPMSERGFKASRYRPETVDRFRNRSHEYRLAGRNYREQLNQKVTPKAGKSVKGKAALIAGGAVVAGGAIGAGVTHHRQKREGR